MASFFIHYHRDNNYISFLFLLILAISTIMTTFAQTDCQKTLEQYMKQYPASDLCDVYKFCFQDVFGPAHLTIDTAKSIKYIEEELEKSKTLGGPDYEFVGCDGNYVRVNISLVKRSILTASDLALCLSRSADVQNPMSVEDWSYRWHELEEILNNITPRPGHFALDSESIESLLNRGGYTVRHSYSYNSTYNFHYRIIRRDIFEQEILPLLKTKRK